MYAPRLWLVATGVTAAVLAVAEAKGPPADRFGDLLPAGAVARLGTTRWRHGGDITFVAFGAEGKTLVTAGQDNTVRVWDLATGHELRQFAPRDSGPSQPRRAVLPGAQARTALPAAPDGLRVAVTGDGKTLAVANHLAIHLYDIASGSERRAIDGPSTGLVGLLFSPDGRLLAGRGPDGTVTLWEADTGKGVDQLKGPPPPQARLLVARALGRSDAPGMAFTPDSASLAVATTEYHERGTESYVKVWDVTTGKETSRIKGPDGLTVSGVAYSPDGKWVAYGAANGIHLCDADSGAERRTIVVPDGIATPAFSPDGKALAVRGRGQQIHVWDAESGKERFTKGERAPVAAGAGVVFVGAQASAEMRNLAFAPDGKQLVSGVGSAVRLWDAGTGQPVPLGDGHQGALAAVVLSPDGRTVVSWSADHSVRRWEAATGKPLNTFAVPPRMTLGCLSPDGQLAAFADGGNAIHLIDTATGKERQKLIGSSTGTTALAFSPDGKVLAARTGNDHITLFDVAAGGELRTLNPPAATSMNGLVVVKAAGRAPGGARAGLVFAPDGKLLASPGTSAILPGTPGTRSTRSTVDLYDVDTGKVIRKLEVPQPVTSLTFSPDGRVLATENGDHTFTLWEVASGQERGRLGKSAGRQFEPTPVALVAAKVGLRSAEPASPTTLAFAANGRALLARGLDRAVHVWDVDAAQAVNQFPGHQGRVEALALSPDGRLAASGSADTTVLVWDAAALLHNLPKLERAELSDDAVRKLWNDLTSADAGQAAESLRKLAGAPAQAVPFLAERLEPAAAVDVRQLERWVADLESEKYAARREAAVQLVQTGEQAVPALQKVLASRPTIEARKRAEEILDRLTGGALNAEQLRLVRAVEMLERIDTAESRQLLRTLADGAPGALATRQAQAALSRLR